MEAIEPSQVDVDLLDWEADSMAPMQSAQQLLPNRDPSPEPSEDKTGSDSCSDDEFNNNPESDEDELRPAKRKRLSLSNGPIHKKRKH
jgi:hypothetical protein